MRLPPLNHWKTLLAPLPAGSSPIGDITLAGTISGSRGIRRDHPRVFGQWAVVYLLAGKGDYVDARGTEMPVQAGDVILVFPELAHSYGPPPGGEWNELHVCFQGAVFEAWRNSGLFDIRRPVFHWQEPGRGLSLMQEFFSLLGRKGLSMVDVACEWQTVLATIFTTEPVCNGGAPQPKWYRRALDLLDRGAGGEKKGLREVAAECGMGYESFRKNFTTIAGQPPGRYALARRIDRARALLSRHRFTNKELADLLGFHDEFHFAKTFKRMTGQTPASSRGAGIP